METLIQDIRYALRVLLKNPGFTAVAVVTLALGIGANCAIFSVVNSVLLRPLPYPEPDRLVVLSEHNPQTGPMSVAWPNFTDWRDQGESFEAMAAYRMEGRTFTGHGEPAFLLVGVVSPSFFQLLGVSPSLGRVFSDSEDNPGATPVVVLSHKFWQSRFGQDPGILGQAIAVDGSSYTVIGVLPSDFRYFIQDAELYFPIGRQSNDPVWVARSNHPGLRVLARLKQDVSFESAQVEMNTIASRLEQQYPYSNSGQTVEAQRLYDFRFSDISTGLYLMLAAVALVLLIACANVANLLLSRATSRGNEIAIRTAIGAGRARLLRQLLTESVLLSLIGGGIGLLLAIWGIEPLLQIAPQDIPRIGDVRLDLNVVGYTFAVALLTGIIFGLAPALQLSKVDLNSALKHSVRGSTSGKSGRVLRAAFSVAQVALAMVLVIGAGLLVRSIIQLNQVDPGFKAERVLTMGMALSRTQYKEPNSRLSFVQQAIERIRALPGVQSAAAVMCLPMTGGCWGSVYLVEGEPVPAQSEIPSSPFNIVDTEYFQTMSVPLLKGRYFTEGDSDNSPPVIIINQTMANRWWPGESPIGKRIKQGFPQDDAPYREIVGVIPDITQGSLESPQKTEVYLPLAQSPPSFVNLVIRTSNDPMLLANAISHEIYGLNKDQPVVNVKPMTTYLSDSMATHTFSTLLLGMFAALALILAAIGIYGVMSYSVTQRKQEIGIRMALGAGARDIVSLVVGEAALLAVLGVAIGLGIAFWLTDLMSTLLFRVSTTDAETFAVVAALLCIVTLVASYVPARRATKVDPMIALRYE